MIRRSGAEVVELCIDVPETRNALGLHELEALDAALEDIRSDAIARVVVLRAAGRVFSSGSDLRDLDDPVTRDRSAMLLRRIIGAICDLDQPVVCVVDGAAFGGAVALLAVADLVIATDRARVALPEVRFGMVATVAAATCLPRIGLTATLDLLLTGRQVLATEACDRGLFSVVVPSSELDQIVRERVDELLLGAPSAIAVTKRTVRALAGSSIDNGIGLALALGAAASADDHRAGLAAVLERTSPPWTSTWAGFGDDVVAG